MAFRLLPTLAALVLVCSGCAAFTPKPEPKPALSYALAARINASEQAQTELVRTVFRDKRAAVDQFIDEVWTPVFLDNLAAKKEVRTLLRKAVKRSSRKGGKQPAGVLDLIPQARIQIDERRSALRAPLDALEQQFLDAVRSQARGMSAINDVLAAAPGKAVTPAAARSGVVSPATFAQALVGLSDAVAALDKEAPRSRKLLDVFPLIKTHFEQRLQAIGAAVAPAASAA